VHDRLRLLAAACLAQADVMDSDAIREQVQLPARRLIPPASLDDAELLARAGPFVLPVRGPERYATEVLADVDFVDRRLEIQRWSARAVPAAPQS
jgi:hypothetical protein